MTKDVQQNVVSSAEEGIQDPPNPFGTCKNEDFYVMFGHDPQVNLCYFYPILSTIYSCLRGFH